MDAKRYVFDLDNTLCDTQKNQNGHWDYSNSKPFVDRIEKVNKLFEEGNYIIIETARGSVSKKNWYEETYNQLVSFGLKFNELRTGVKFNGDIFIDDKGINSELFFSEDNIEILDVYNENTKITLFNEIFVEKNDLRLDEYVYCINKNIENELIEKIYLVCNRELYFNNRDYFEVFLKTKIKYNNKIRLILDDNKRFTFNKFINYTKNILNENQIVCVTNLDVFIPMTNEWKNLEKDFFSFVKNDCCLALSRTEYINDSYSFRDERAWQNGEFADCWIFKTPIKIQEKDFPFEIPVGSAPTCDNHMFLIMGNTHRKVFNWAEKYIVYHYDLIRKPDVLEKKSGRMIMNDDVVKLETQIFDKIPADRWKISPYKKWDKFLEEIKLENKMKKGALEDKFAFEEIKKLVKEFKIERIIETGTYLGWSTKKLCELGIKIDSIEIDKKYFDIVKESLVEENLKLHLGNSVEILEKIINENEENLLIFIDSHWYDLPILEELKVFESKKIKPILVIHDFFVPDENGKAKYGYDKYDNINLDFGLIQNNLEKIYDGEFSYYYNTQIDCVDSGIIFITPKK